MADFSSDKKYNYNWQSSKFKNLAFSGSNISQFVNDIGYITSAGSSSAATGSFLITASVSSNTITFTKGDGSTFPLTVNTGSGGGATPPGSPNTSVQFNGNGVFSGSSNFIFNSASNALTLTGSLNITGSTLQVGNNTLIGNTTLSGSIIISGSNPPGSPTASVQIYGDIRQSGYHRFDPVLTNIDTSISASYIYVSGSTNDLYFSQNGAGYNNVTRLRWLEGNLYTGLLHGGLITTQSSTVYQVGSGSGIIVNLNASLPNDPYPTVQYLQWPNLSASIAPLSQSFDQSFVAITSSGGTAVITTKGTPYEDGDYNTKIPIGIVIHQNHSTINAFQTFPGVGYGWKQRSFDFVRAFGPLKITGYNLSVSGSSTGSLVLSGGTSFVDGRNYSIDQNNPSYIVEANGITTSKIYRYYQSGSDWVYLTNGGAGYGAIDPTQYSLSGSLTPVATNNWTIQRVFYFPNSATKAFYIYYGNVEYANKADAIAGLLTEPFSEAPNTAANALLVGYMILRYNANFTTAASYEFRPAGLFRGSGAGGAGGGGGTTTPGGSTTQIQYNNAGVFGGVTNLTWNGTTLNATGSFSGSFTGTLTGTSSYATQALSASYAPTIIPSGPFGIANSSGSYTYYTTFSSSIAAATSGQTVEIFADITETGSVTITLKNGVNINGNGHTYTLNNSGLIHALSAANSVTTSCNILNLNVIRTGSTGSILDNSALILGINGTGTINCAGSTFRNNGSGCGVLFNTNSTHEINYAVAYATTIYGAFGIFTSAGGKLNNCIGYGTSGGTGIRCHNGGDIQNCVGYSDSGYGIYGLAGNQSNSVGISTSGNGFFSATSTFNCIGRSTSGIGFEALNGTNIVGCVGISVSGRGISTQNVFMYNCTGISSSSSGVSFAGTGKAYNITAKSSTSYAMWGAISTCQLYGGTIICDWNNAAGYGIRGNGGSIINVITNCTFNLSNLSAPYLFNDGVAQAITMRGNTYQGGAVFNANLTQATISTQDNQGNIYL